MEEEWEIAWRARPEEPLTPEEKDLLDTLHERLDEWAND